ncbi:MAG TPA: hypothetical protein VE032_08755 [Actinomycetota bacterium]|nr:hypothetical protein [Actinomycetota bacterium]
MTRTWFVRTLAPVAIAALVLAGCGGDDTSSAPSAPDGATDTSTGDGGIFDTAECAQAVAAWGSAASAAGAAMTAGAGDLESSLSQLQAFAASAPEEIRADLTTVYEAYGAFLAAMQDVGYDPTSGTLPTQEQIAAMEEASQALEGTDVEAASERVSAWFADNCGT